MVKAEFSTYIVVAGTLSAISYRVGSCLRVMVTSVSLAEHEVVLVATLTSFLLRLLLHAARVGRLILPLLQEGSGKMAWHNLSTTVRPLRFA